MGKSREKEVLNVKRSSLIWKEQRNQTRKKTQIDIMISKRFNLHKNYRVMKNGICKHVM